MNRKGFTLVELLAMMVVIAILMLIAIPNIVGILQKNRESQGIEDVNNMINGAKSKISSKQAKNPQQKQNCVLMTLDFIDSTNNITTGQNGSPYNRTESFVIIKKEDKGSYSNYQYYFRLVEVDAEANYVLGYKVNDTGDVVGFVSFETFSQKPTAPIKHELSDDEKLSLNNPSGIDAFVSESDPLCQSFEEVYKDE